MNVQERFEKINAIEVGNAAFFIIGSDRYAYHVVEVNRYKSGAKAGQVKEVVVQDVIVDWSKGQNYGVYDQSAFQVDENGKKVVFNVRKNGVLREVGSDYGALHVGRYEEYRDPSF